MGAIVARKPSPCGAAFRPTRPLQGLHPPAAQSPGPETVAMRHRFPPNQASPGVCTTLAAQSPPGTASRMRNAYRPAPRGAVVVARPRSCERRPWSGLREGEDARGGKGQVREQNGAHRVYPGCQLRTDDSRRSRAPWTSISRRTGSTIQYSGTPYRAKHAHLAAAVDGSGGGREHLYGDVGRRPRHGRRDGGKCNRSARKKTTSGCTNIVFVEHDVEWRGHRETACRQPVIVQPCEDRHDGDLMAQQR